MNHITSFTAEKNTIPDGFFLNLDHLKSIETEYLNSIINGTWGIISLNGLKSISPNIADILGKHKGILSPNGIKTLNYESALYLMGHQGTIFLKGIKTLDNSIAELFSKTNETIILGLETVDNSTAHILSHPHGVIVYSSKILEQVRRLVNGI